MFLSFYKGEVDEGTMGGTVGGYEVTSLAKIILYTISVILSAVFLVPLLRFLPATVETLDFMMHYGI